MAITLLILLPLLASVPAYLLPTRRGRRATLLACAAAHLALTARFWVVGLPPPALEGYLNLDPLGLVFLTTASVIFLATAAYGVKHRDLTPPARAPGYNSLHLILLAAMTLLTSAGHFGLLWVASGAMTLCTAPLIYLEPGQRSLEATWKYLILCSVGVALALLGIFFVAIAATGPSGSAPELLFEALTDEARAGRLSIPWLRTGFIFVLVGFGTKVGLAPMHTWKPDTYSEVPTPVGALMASALCNCAFLCVLRGYQVCAAAGQAAFAGDLMVLLGVVSAGTAAAFLVAQNDAKRLLAYSGVEQMGLMAFGVGAGGKAIYGALLHVVAYSLAKSALFFVVGNVILVYGTRSIPEITGVVRRMPVTGVLLMASCLAVLAFPPGSVFLSEVLILAGALGAGRYVATAVLLVFLAIIFVAEWALVSRMAQGPDPRGEAGPREREPLLLLAPPLALVGLVMALGVRVPVALDDALARAAAVLGG